VQDLYLNLDELHLINKRLGGYSVSKKGLTKIAKKKKSVKNILDVGFGGGHSILELSSHSNDQLFFYGVDLKQECVDYAERTLSKVTRKSLMCNDYKNLEADLLKNIDVIHCSLFLHHLSNEEIVEFFQRAKRHDCTVLVNDLHRNWFAYYSIKLITALFSTSRLVKHDAAVSVARGFTKQELVKLVEQAGYKNYTVKWCWAFRYLIIAEN
jgi:2-polyprenyl-3-methyl-5-hydroxy-6-metoxy-1,4-benzoquinol methylase